MKQLLRNCRLFDGERVHDDQSVVISEGNVLELVAAGQDCADTVAVDLAGNLLAPGLIDLQVNGGGGVLFNDAPSVATLATIAAAHRPFGTTSFLATLISDDNAIMEQAIAAVNAGLRPGYAYGRKSNPTQAALEKALCELENGQAAIALSSGMAAI